MAAWRPRTMLTASIILLFIGLDGVAAPLSGTAPLEWDGDLAERMVTGMHRDADARTATARNSRLERWKASGLSSDFVAGKREKLRKLLGAVDSRDPTAMETIAAPGAEGPIAENQHSRLYAVRWPVYAGAFGEGLLVEPKGVARASLVLIPDAGQDPAEILSLTGNTEQGYGSTLLAPGIRILIPVLIDRADTWSGTEGVRMTNQPHREWIYRGAYEMGRHPIGYELQKVFAGIDWLKETAPGAPVGVIGHGEGGLLALHAAALDTRIQAAVISGYFGPREGLWEAPIYRNVWSLLTDFGDAELAALVAPRTLIVEPATPPQVTGPPMTEGRAHGAAPGAVPTPSLEAIQVEITRAETYAANDGTDPWLILSGDFGGAPGQSGTLRLLAEALSIAPPQENSKIYENPGPLPDPDARMKRQVEGLLGWTDYVLAEAPHAREAFWKKADPTSARTWETSTDWYRTHFHESIIGKLPESTLPLNPRTRQIFETEAYTGYEVALDVYDDVFASGILLLPKGIQEGEERPVVVCQHGLEGRPEDLADPEQNHRAYEQYACKLAEEGFVVYAPQNPYIGGDHFRSVQRKANPLGLSLFSYIIEQHRQTLKWLDSLPFVDGERMAFYGLSYGGKTAMRVPAVLEDYCLSICSGDFNEWIWKNVTRRRLTSYVFHGEYEMFEWNLGETYNYAEMSWLICPRPFMVERGHWDGVAPDEWVGYEFARVRNRYDLLGLTDEAAIEWFNGPHKINADATFQFLRDKLDFARKR